MLLARPRVYYPIALTRTGRSDISKGSFLLKVLIDIDFKMIASERTGVRGKPHLYE